MTLRAPVLALLLSTWLAGCVTETAPTSRYALPDTTNATAPVAGAAATYRLVVSAPELARFLDVEGIILQLDDITLNEAQRHQWASPLGQQLARGMRRRLAVRLPDTRVMDRAEPAGTGASPSLTLHLEVDRFHGRFDGQAVAGGQWQLRNADGRLVALSPFTVTTELDADGYPALVRALGESWDKVADEIADAIEKLR
ncbi:PqiC family protein [Halomonas cerina]|uniref:ABC-type transport auxiliary lipoprotein component domain-containing protein n=1 Tax=Halomonas cerina TaxID=447424 RepID=A0A839V8I1_9GAMM|nr:ABC-type transport auxiliary lipoprotein family protein [Halomonas cerina]MBB3189014.1 hypothetical protein [Halomonas cerina]